MNWFIPALVSRSPDSGGGISDEDGTRLCPRSSKKRRNSSRIRSPSMAAQSSGVPAPPRNLRAEGFRMGAGTVAQALGPQLGERDAREPVVVDHDDVAH